MNKLKLSSISQNFNRFRSRYRIFLDGLPFLMSLFVGAVFLSRITKKRFVKDNVIMPTKEEMLKAGIDIDSDLASAELDDELKRIQANLDTESWKNVPINKK
ncbi:uncharacterized protein LOC132562803 [Ylistrum balloti]|uniref:uncharacterized protein LOC132562803 n=1 Tax=Ylistrum balloti TaxID=509963 RepID=UPI002905E231|nr:uncharacterized protein LOC132562803 [Ylistrum balloti]